jgi:hypothetical protein
MNQMTAAFILALLLAPLATLHAADTKRPNVVLFLIDDQDKPSIGVHFPHIRF